MGLDMNLSVSDYVSGWDFSNQGEKEKFNRILEAAGYSRDSIAEGSPSLTLKIKVAYWRKANAIHNWFVENCQNGVDECQESEVSREDLQNLRDTAQEALLFYNAGNAALAAEALPTRSGFFFGSVQIDEMYANDLKDTIEQIDKILNDPRFNDKWFIYQSSW